MNSNRTDLVEESEHIVAPPSTQKFKLANFLDSALKSRFLHELFRFGIYTLSIFIVLTLLNKNVPSAIYSVVARDESDRSIFLRKQIPGIFPSLTKNTDSILNKWSIAVIRGPNGSQQFVQTSYQLEFKHFNEKKDVVYITKDNCNGHLIMNWETYSNNIFFTEYVPPATSMIIPNEPEDEACIKKNSEVVQLLKFGTVWTVSEENQKTALFLLVEKITENNQHLNYVIVADEYKKM